MSEPIDWQVESLRVTAFPVDIEDVSAEMIWETSIGRMPDETRIQRSGIETREAEFGNGRIFLTKQIDRIDWRYHTSKEEEDEPSVLPIIGSLDTELLILKQLAEDWITSSTVFPINRLAFAGVLLYPVESISDGYYVLGKLLPSLYLENVKDLSYQVNRPRTSETVEGVSINRLSRWNVIRSHLVTAVPSARLRFQSAADELVACRMEIDINSEAEHSEPFAAHSLLRLLDELIGIGLELSEYGDVL